MKADHAIHNREMCDVIIAKGGFNDWAVTTAFYASLHFVHFKIFPLALNGKNYKTFDAYFAHEIRKNNPAMSKHEATLDLVYQYCPSIAFIYHKLFLDCHSARYQNFRIATEAALSARKNLQTIEKICSRK